MLTLFSLLFSSPWTAITFLIQLLTTTSFIPYKVDRPARRVPYVTYSLIGLNTFIFLLTIFIANIRLPGDRILGQQEIKNYLQQAENSAPSAESNPDSSDPYAQQKLNQARRNQALSLADRKVMDTASYERIYQIQHADSTYVIEPHYSVLNIFAYRPGDKSFWSKLLGLFGSMFLHGGFLHLAGNMIFLWTFGRAMEENLGARVYLGAYILSGIAAVLMFHVSTMLFAPDSRMLPYLGASGAVAGVMGFFTMRFYRTPVNIFYIQPITLLCVFIAALVGGFVGSLFLHTIGFFAGFFGVWIAFFLYMRKLAFGSFKMPSAWAIGVWLVVFNLFPAIGEALSHDAGGVAVWAHIGGFLFGVGYAGLIGSKGEGGKEYLLEDAQKTLGTDSGKAMQYARNLLEREPKNGGAYHVLATAHSHQNDTDAALDNYELAIKHLLRSGERDQAADAYLEAVRKYETFILPPDQQLAVGNQMAKNGNFQNAAETLVKIPYTFPQAAESEISLLRSAQFYLQHFNDPNMSMQLLQEFLRRYPDSQWKPQVDRIMQQAYQQLNPPLATDQPR